MRLRLARWPRKMAFLAALAWIFGSGLLIRPTLAADPIHPILYNGYLLGGSKNGAWVDAETTAAALRGGEGYRVYAGQRDLGRATGGAPDFLSVSCPSTQYVQLNPAPGVAASAIGGDWNAIVRTGAEIPTTSRTYRSLMEDFLRKQGIKNPDVRLTRVLRVDLEGDGPTEVLISATRYTANDGTVSRDAAAGDYSFVVMRKIVNGKVETQQLAGEYYPSGGKLIAPPTYAIAEILDANNDGRLEVMVRESYFEGLAARLHQLVNNRISPVLSAGCGE